MQAENINPLTAQYVPNSIDLTFFMRNNIKKVIMKRLFYIVSLLFLFSSCASKSKLEAIDENSKQQSELLDVYCQIDSLIQRGIVDRELCDTFIKRALGFYQEFPEESITPKMLWSAGIVARTYAKYAKEFLSDSSTMVEYAKQSITIFDIIQKVYPDYEDVKNIYLYRGDIYDNILEDYDNAKYEYLEYINKYPNDSMSNSLKEYIKYLGVSADDIYKNFNISE